MVLARRLLLASALLAVSLGACRRSPVDRGDGALGRAPDTAAPALADAPGPPPGGDASASPHGPAAADVAERDVSVEAADVGAAVDDADAGRFYADVEADLRACRRGVMQACERAAAAAALGGPRMERDEELARELFERACAAGRHDACRRVALLLLRPGAAAADVTRGLRLLERGCEQQLPIACAQLGDVLRTGALVPADAYRALERYQQACKAGYAGACVSIRRMRAVAESYDLPLPRTVPAPAAAREPAPEAVCPTLVYGQPEAMGTESLGRGLFAVGGPTLAAALTATIGDWRLRPLPEEALPATLVGLGVVYEAGERTLNVRIDDRLAACTLQPGTGAAMLRWRADSGGESAAAVRAAGRPAVRIRHAARVELLFWLGDRCEVRLSADSPANAGDLEAVAAGLGLRALEAACAQRAGPDWP